MLRSNFPVQSRFSMACTLDLYTDYLISSTGQTSATGLSRLFDGQLSHDQVRRWLSQVHLDSRQVWGHAKPLIRQTERALKADDFAVLVVDDSILEKARPTPAPCSAPTTTSAWDAT